MRGGELALEDYAGHVGSVFTAKDDAGAPVPFELVEAAALQDHRPEPVGRAPFALLFTTVDDRLFDQGTIALDHPAMGALALFLVPIGRDERGARYEAVFN